MLGADAGYFLHFVSQRITQARFTSRILAQALPERCGPVNGGSFELLRFFTRPSRPDLVLIQGLPCRLPVDVKVVQMLARRRLALKCICEFLTELCSNTGPNNTHVRNQNNSSKHDNDSNSHGNHNNSSSNCFYLGFTFEPLIVGNSQELSQGSLPF